MKFLMSIGKFILKVLACVALVLLGYVLMIPWAIIGAAAGGADSGSGVLLYIIIILGFILITFTFDLLTFLFSRKDKTIKYKKYFNVWRILIQLTFLAAGGYIMYLFSVLETFLIYPYVLIGLCTFLALEISDIIFNKFVSKKKDLPGN